MLQGHNNAPTVFAAGHLLLAHSPSSAHLLQPLSGPPLSDLQTAQGEQHAAVHLPTVTPPAGNGGSCQEKSGPTSLDQFVQWVCNLQNEACPNVLQLHGKVILQGTGLQRHQAATVAARVTAACEHSASLQGEALITNKPSFFYRLGWNLEVVSPASSMAICYSSIMLLVCSCHN